MEEICLVIDNLFVFFSFVIKWKINYSIFLPLVSFKFMQIRYHTIKIFLIAKISVEAYYPHASVFGLPFNLSKDIRQVVHLRIIILNYFQ